MPEEVLALTIIAIAFGSSLIGLALIGIYKLIRAKIDQGNNNSGQINPQFFKALGEFKKNTERRIAMLEDKVSDLEEERYRVTDSEDSVGDIEIEDDEVRSPAKNKDESEGNLRNMLNE